MKKIITLSLVCFLGLSLTGCQKENQETAATINNNQEQTKEIVNKINSTKNMENTAQRMLDGQEDLLATYSSAKIKTSLGDITVKFYQESPVTVNNFMNLAKSDFYNNTKFHRVIKDFMIQAGDPNSKTDNTDMWGMGGPDYRFSDEFNTHPLVAGSLAMANSGANTNGSQFFIVTAAATPWLDGRHTNFGEVTGGMDVVEKIEATKTGESDRPAQNISITGIELLK